MTLGGSTQQPAALPLPQSKIVARFAAIVVMSVALLSLTGWILDIAILKSLYGDITMKANAALALGLAGLSLMLLTLQERKSLKILGSFCAGLSGIIGALTLSEHLFGWDLHIDQLLFREPQGALATTSPGRMGPPASSCFLLSGTAMLLLYQRRGISYSQILALLVLLISILPILGYAYQAEQLYGIAPYTGIALNTAISIQLLGIGILFLRIREGFMAVMSGKDISGTMSRRLIIPAIIVPFILGWFVLTGKQTGFYDAGFATALFVLLIISIFGVAIWGTANALDRMEQKRVRTEEALRASEVRFQIAIKHAPLIVFNHDTDLRYTWIHNPVLGLGTEDVIGKRDDELLPDADALPLMQIKRSVIETGVSARQEVTIDHAGKRYYYDLSVEPLRDEAGNIAGITCAAVDISEIKQVESQLRQANQLKDEFLATVSHELRTPLNSILGWALMLRRHRLDETSTKRAIEIIEHSARIQAQLIEDLLDVSRIVSGKLRLDTKTMELTSVIQSAIDSMRHAAEAKQIDIELIPDASAGEIIGDPTRIQQVIWNLLSNAVKFTPIGGRVQVKAERIGTNVRVTVTDNGEGISPEFVPYVFDRFQQADGTITRRHGGLGLGLAIVRHLVEMHGGTIAAFSDGLGKGATFQVDFPLHDPGDVPRPDMIPVDNVLQAADDSSDQILAGLKILIVDDESNAREMLATFLAKHGASITAAASAAEALESVLKAKPDLLVCDIGMPEEDGYTLIHKIRALTEANGKDIPAIALTGYVRIEERVRALQEGFQMFVAKPVEPDELISSIITLIAVPGERAQN